KGWLEQHHGETKHHSSLTQQRNLFNYIHSLRECFVQNKKKLSKLLCEFDEVKENWSEATENLKSCLNVNQYYENTVKQCQNISVATDKVSEHLKSRIQHLVDLTDKIHTKSAV